MAATGHQASGVEEVSASGESKLRALDDRGVHVAAGVVADNTGGLPRAHARPPSHSHDKQERNKFAKGEVARLLRLNAAAAKQGVQAERACEVLATVDPRHTLGSYVNKWQKTKSATTKADLDFEDPFPGLADSVAE
ncbi:hypothetical protein PV04_09803 [Phialophora macrospora]|uniref:Uncharacterized protein n=1 Tax=Phialophora macrospora TaxID=1851006 RepID=A0A0D2F7G1_9EURO|nr:hypothetical protein PV04_09803 [Phialophora macrospora]